MTTSAAKRAKPRLETTSVVGDGRDLEVLASIAWAGILSTSQIERLHFPSRRRAQRRLRALLDHGLLRAHLQGEALQRENVFTATERGLERLVEEGFFEGRAPKAMRLPRPQHLPHALAVREVFVAAVLAERAGCFEIQAFQYEHDLRDDSVLAAANLHPDALLSTTREQVEDLVGVEVDRGTETRATLRAKFEVWRRVLSVTGARRRFDTAHLLVTAPRETRRLTLQRLLAEVGIADRACVVLPEGLAALFASGWPHSRAAAPIRTNAPHEFADTSFTAAQDDGFRPVGR